MTSACAGVTMENELKEYRSFECVQLFNPDLQGEMARAMLRLPLVMPVDGMDECARGVFLRAKRAVVSFSPGPFSARRPECHGPAPERPRRVASRHWHRTLLSRL